MARLPIHNHEFPAYILAGGKSSRFGSDKAYVPIQGIPNLLRLKQTLESHQHSVQVVADCEDRYADLKIQSVADSVPDSGPMAGLAASLQHRRESFGEGWILLISCDQVVWQAVWFQQLVQGISSSTEAVVFCSEAPQPIPGLYHTALLPMVEKAVCENQLSIRRLLLQIAKKTCIITSEDNPRRASFNDPEELTRILRDYKLD